MTVSSSEGCVPPPSSCLSSTPSWLLRAAGIPPHGLNRWSTSSPSWRWRGQGQESGPGTCWAIVCQNSRRAQFPDHLSPCIVHRHLCFFFNVKVSTKKEENEHCLKRKWKTERAESISYYLVQSWNIGSIKDMIEHLVLSLFLHNCIFLFLWLGASSFV